MNLYKTTITPISNFATLVYGDTLFGQICWIIKYKFGKEKLQKLLSTYDKNPFLVVSDGFAKGYLPKPSLPSNLLNENSDEKKENRKKIWLTLDDLKNGDYHKAKKNEEIGYKQKVENVIKNKINYKTFMTGEGFDPYSEEEISYSPLDIYFLIDENQFLLEELQEVLELLSQVGYGKNTTIGKGRFEFSTLQKQIIDNKSTTFMGLSVASLNQIQLKDIYYDTFVRFGKHGGDLATNTPFKKPLLLAKRGFVVVFEEAKEIQYIGSKITGHSAHKETIHQGYSIVIPIKEI